MLQKGVTYSMKFLPLTNVIKNF